MAEYEYQGIRNENEFYFAHYLSALMDKDLSDLSQDEALEQAREGLAKLHQEYAKVRKLRERVEQRDGRTFGDDAKAYGQARGAFVEKLVNVLGYGGVYRPASVAFLGRSLQVPVAGMVTDGAGRVQVVLIDSCRMFTAARELKEATILGNLPTEAQLACEGLRPEDCDALSMCPRQRGRMGERATWERLLTTEIFAAPNAPRFVIVLAEEAVLLADCTKWAEKRSLVFLLNEIFAQGNKATYRAMASLLHRKALAPNAGETALPDRLDAESHKNAFGVSKSLRYAMREAIEDLGNAIVANLPQEERIDAASLTKECILVMYRFLFILFLESRRDLHYFERSDPNAANDIFWSAYGLDHLRDLETVPLMTEAAKQGHYFDLSIKQLFAKIWEGVDETSYAENPGVATSGFRLRPLRAHLFDPSRTPRFNAAAIPNAVWQKIVYSLSIGEAGTGKDRRTGRISYAQLGIQQLGSVYEALLSYTGFYAEEDLYEVREATQTRGGGTMDEEEQPQDDGDDGAGAADIFETGYFITASELENYRECEIVARGGQRVCYRKGSFIYRMAGRERKRSASYYTPNELTRCLVRQTIAERVTPEMTAAEMMQLTICEPAMGSAAFLNEMVDQLAELYLKRAEQERHEVIPFEERAAKKARVKMVIADKNVYGVDLNPMAADLAEVSLWLGTIGGEQEPTGQERAEPYIPWFGNQLVCGNSIVGARREVVLFDGTHQKVGFGEPLPKQAIWHFLLPDEAMALKLDKVVTGLCPEAAEKLRRWRRAFKAKKADYKRLYKLTEQIDALWEQCAAEAKRVSEETFDDVDYYGHTSQQRTCSTLSAKDKLLADISKAEELKKASATFRLKMILDLWCALWFWPLDTVDELPDYEQFLEIVTLLATLKFTQEGQMYFEFWDDLTRTRQADELVKAFKQGPTFERLYRLFPFAKTAHAVAERQHFLHWEHTFVNVFAQRGGFDFIIGNPPWVKVDWKEADLLSEYDPHIAIRNYSADQTRRGRLDIFEKSAKAKETYLMEYANTVSMQQFLKANYGEYIGGRANLYKYFLPLSFRIVTEKGVTGLIHPDGVYDATKGGKLRAILYPRLRLHAHFRNILKLFDISTTRRYSLNVYGEVSNKVFFKSVSNLLHPDTLINSLQQQSYDTELPLEKTIDGEWNLTGHRDRVVMVTDDTLQLFAAFYDGPDVPARQARLPAIYAQRFLTPILSTFANYTTKMGRLRTESKYSASQCWNQTDAVGRGILVNQTRFATLDEEIILAGPHIFVGTPINQTARIHGGYDTLDFTVMPEVYRPRVNQFRNIEFTDYLRRLPLWKGQSITNYYRLLCRHMISIDGERSLIPAIIPPGWAHIHGIVGYCIDTEKMSAFASMAGAWMTIPFDWFIKNTGKENLGNDVIDQLPVIPWNPRIAARALLLNCLTREYAELWREAWDEAYRADGWLSADEHLTPWQAHLEGGCTWQWATPLRTQLDRRQALVELDVLVARALGLTLEDLLLMYRVSFTILRRYDAETYYDQNGRCVFSTKKGEAYLSRQEWEAIKAWQQGTFKKEIEETVFSDEPTKRTIVYEAPFFRKDREADYREAWKLLEEREVRQ